MNKTSRFAFTTSALAGLGLLACSSVTNGADAGDFTPVDGAPIRMAQLQPPVTIDPVARNAAMQVYNVGAMVYQASYLDLDFTEVSRRIITAFPEETRRAANVSLTALPANPQLLFGAIQSMILTAPNGDYHAFSETVLQSFMTGLDAHSSYLTRDEIRDFQTDKSGHFGGLGLQVQKDETTGFIRIEGLMEGGPSGPAGIRAGDLITAIEGVSTSGIELDQAVERMRGALGTAVNITIRREGEAADLDFRIVRASIRQTPVVSTVIEMNGDRVGYVRISSFSELANEDMAAAITAMEQGPNAPTSYILDLRGNPGGLLTQAGEVADRFLTDGKIVSERDRYAERGSFTATPDDIINGKRLVVLIDGGSASASEIVSGALQRFGRAVVIGNQSFGKGSVQTIMPMGDGAVRLTTQLYYIGGDTPIQGYGVVPDIRVDFGMAAEMESRITLRESALDGVIANPNDTVPSQVSPQVCQAARTGDTAFQGIDPRLGNEQSGFVDSTMLCAIEYLNNQSVYSVVRPVATAPRP